MFSSSSDVTNQYCLLILLLKAKFACKLVVLVFISETNVLSLAHLYVKSYHYFLHYVKSNDIRCTVNCLKFHDGRKTSFGDFEYNWNCQRCDEPFIILSRKSVFSTSISNRKTLCLTTVYNFVPLSWSQHPSKVNGYLYVWWIFLKWKKIVPQQSTIKKIYITIGHCWRPVVSIGLLFNLIRSVLRKNTLQVIATM